MVAGSKLNPIWRPMSYSPCTIASEEPSLLTNLAQLLDGARKEFDADHGAAKALLIRAASLLRVEIERKSGDAGGDRETGGLVAWQIRRLNVLIEARLDQPIFLRELSAAAKLSEAYFCRAFKRTFHETPHSYVVRRRLERAVSLMLTSDLSLCDIALRCGFTDQAHLCKQFRRRYAQTPAAWRRERTEVQSHRSVNAPGPEYAIGLS
jgi:AraC family transcriptional regulator